VKKPLWGSGNPRAATGEPLCGNSREGLPQTLHASGREGPWSVAGNGRKMGAAKQELRTGRARGKTGKTTRKKRGKREEKRDQGPSGEETAVLDGVEQLRQAVDRRLGKNSEKIADVLEAKALQGDLATTKAMVGIAEKKKPEPVKKRHEPILPWSAAELAREPQWEGKELGDEEDSD